MIGGFNPLRWECHIRGCFNRKNRLKLEVFADVLPGRIGMTDVDGAVEVNGSFLFLEWKGGEQRELPRGQHLFLERLTRLHANVTAVVVIGDAETMDVAALRVVSGGRFGAWESATLNDLKARIRRWAMRASSKTSFAKDFAA